MTRSVPNLQTSTSSAEARPVALVVLLENVGHIHGVTLPFWLRAVIDFVSETYAKFILLLYGAHRAYDRVVVLEDAQAKGQTLSSTLRKVSETHRVDLFLLVHGLEGGLVGYRGHVIGRETFEPLLQRVRTKPELLDLRAVYGLNCYGSSLEAAWRSLGARAVCGARGVNWFPEPGLSGFLWPWLRGRSFKEAAASSNRTVRWLGGRLLGEQHAAVKSSLLFTSGEDLRLRESE